MTDNTSTQKTGDYLLGRNDLRAWHYAHEGSVEPHQGFHDGSAAWTHCTCFGAAHRAVEPLLAEVERLRAVEAAAKDVLEAHDTADDEMDWTAPAVDMILRRALNEGRHYSSNPQLSDR